MPDEFFPHGGSHLPNDELQSRAMVGGLLLLAVAVSIILIAMLRA